MIYGQGKSDLMKRNKRNFFAVSIEGGDSLGKATQVSILKDALQKLGCRTRAVEVPVKSLITYHVIYFMLRSGLALKFPRLFHFVQFMNKFFWQVIVLPFLVRKYDALILDRWSVSYWVYGLETGLSREGWLMRLYNVFYKPDAVIVLAGSRHGNERRDQYEKDDSLQERVRVGYALWAVQHPEVCKVINANQDVLDVHTDVISVLYEKNLVNTREENYEIS